MFRQILKKIHKKIVTLKNRRTAYLESMVGPPGAWKITQDFQYAFLVKQGLQPHHQLLDIGCGPLRGGIPLIRYLDPNHYVGIDIRPRAIEEAKQEVQRNHLESKHPVLLISDSFGKEELQNRQFDYIWAFQILYHLEDSSADQCIEQISRCLSANGVCYANVNFVREGGTWQDFPYMQKDIAFYETLASRHGLRVQCLGQLKDFKYPDQLKGKLNHLLEFRLSPVDSDSPDIQSPPSQDSASR